MTDNANGFRCRLEEVQSSIAEGKLMLNVLRSLPTTKKNDVFIARFEDLIKRLEDYQFQKKKNEGKDAKLKLRALKEQQDRIKYLLDHLARDIQESNCSTMEASGSCNTATPTNVAFQESASAMLSKFESLLCHDKPETSQEDSQCTPDNNDSFHNPESKQELESTVQSNDNRPTLEICDFLNTNSSRVLERDNSTDQYEAQLSELQGLIEDSEKFNGMVKRLVVITKKAHFNESTKLLLDISKRFTELQISFNSLKESYDSLRNETHLSSELRDIQLSSFREFLSSLSRNFDSTKECFYTIHRLVKTTIEEQLANGTLHELANSDEEDDLPVNADQPSTTNVNAELSTSKQNDEPCVDMDSAFAIQKAYLTALQQRTAQEKEEVAKLLQQRDELAGRLASIKEAASRASLDDVVTSGHTIESTHLSVPVDENECDNSSTGIPPELISSLEAKKRELNQLKGQLELLREAEAKIATFAPVFRLCEPKMTNLSEDTADNNQVISSSQSISQEVSSPKTRSSCNYKEGNDKSTSVKHFNGPPGNLSVSSGGTSTKTDSVTFQQSGVNCSDNTERLYANMREARIKIEEQRNLHDRELLNISNGTNSGSQKPLLQRVSCSGASVATSQDRTTLATWGGSSPVPSCSSEEASEASGEGVSVSDSVPLNSCLPTSGTNTAVVINSPDTPDQLSTVAKRASRKSGHIQGDCSNDNVLHAPSTGDSPYALSLPQVGRSPSPPSSRHKNRSGDNTQRQDNANPVANHRMNSQQNHLGDSTNTSVSQTASHHMVVAPICNDFDDGRMSDMSCAIANERIQRLESSVAQLFQLCRCLMLENSQLNTAVTQLMWHNSSHLSLPGPTSFAPRSSSVGPVAYHHCHCAPSSSAAANCNQVLTTDSGLCGQSMACRQQEQSLKTMPCMSNVCSQNTGVIPPTSFKDSDQPVLHSGVHTVSQIQLLTNQITQQQASISALQSELQRLIRLQTENKSSLPTADTQSRGPCLPNSGDFGLVFSSSVPGPIPSANTASLKSGTSESMEIQNNLSGTTSSHQMSAYSFLTPQSMPVNNWSFVSVPNVCQYPREATLINTGQRSTVQPDSYLPNTPLPLDPRANLTSPHGSSVSQNNLGFSRHH
uniref:Uncharacterized protein n=1 Tax=Trichobilharzia regenti TaxID=157069 RepID=A0AA85KAN3_TRIRE|nr:unnamed protein product [Trichobilharzia regenti]